MKRIKALLLTGLGTVVLWGGLPDLRADITVRISVKFILDSNSNRPAWTMGAGTFDVSTGAAFDAEITHANQVLRNTGRGFRLLVDEYIDIQPPAPAGQNPDYWFNLDARANRSTFETAALADQTAWRWNTAAINIYVNNSSSGQCSFVGGGSSISLGATIFSRGTVVHEVGHFFDLRHTHAGDPDCRTTPGPYMPADGDGLAATVPDHNCLTTRAALLAALPLAQQAAVDTSWLNVMSYHQEDQLLDEQMDIWTKHANGARLFACNGRTWFVGTSGSDQNSGAEASTPFASVSRSLSAVSSPNDVILLKSATYAAPATGRIGTACTLRATLGPATLVRP